MHEEELALEPTTAEEETDDIGVGEEELSKEEQTKARLKEALQFEKEEIGPLRLKLTVTLPEEYLAERMDEQFQELRRDALIPGFRKGHAPIRLVEKRFATDVGDQLKTQLIGGGYMAAVEKAELKPIGDPLFRVKVKAERTPESGKPAEPESEKLLPIDKALDAMNLPKQGPLTFSCEMELKPEFELPSLEKIPVQRIAVDISDDDVTEEIRRMRASKGTFRPVEDGKVERDDLMYASITMSVDGQVVASEDDAELAARDMRVLGVPLVGFADAVIGKNVGETATVEAVVPEDHDNVAIRGKTASLAINVREIKRLSIPPLDEKFLAATGCENEEELRDVVRQVLESTLDDVKKRSMYDQMAKYLLDNTSMQIPEGLSQRQTERSVARRLVEMLQANVPPAEITKAVDELRMKAREQAVHDLKLMFILERIAEDREIDIKEEEINHAVARIARRTNQRFDRVRDELSKGDGMMALALSLRDDKVFDDLLEAAEITEVERPKTTEDD